MTTRRMTVRTRRALNRVRNHARSLVQAVDALEKRHLEELDYPTSIVLSVARRTAGHVSRRLTNLLDHAGDVPVRRVPATRCNICAIGESGVCLTCGRKPPKGWPFTVASMSAIGNCTLSSVGDYRRDDEADEARDVAREMAAREDGA